MCWRNVGGGTEHAERKHQRSSGLWQAEGAGASAWLRSTAPRHEPTCRSMTCALGSISVGGRSLSGSRGTPKFGVATARGRWQYPTAPHIPCSVENLEVPSGQVHHEGCHQSRCRHRSRDHGQRERPSGPDRRCCRRRRRGGCRYSGWVCHGDRDAEPGSFHPATEITILAAASQR